MDTIPFSPLITPLNCSQDLFPIKQEFEDNLLLNTQQQQQQQQQQQSPSSFFPEFSLSSSISNLFLPYDQASLTTSSDNLSFGTPNTENPLNDYFGTPNSNIITNTTANTNNNTNSLSSPLDTDANYFSSPVSSPLDNISINTLPSTYAQLSVTGPTRTEKIKPISSTDPLYKPFNNNNNNNNTTITPRPSSLPLADPSEPVIRKTAVTLTKDEILRFTIQDLDDFVRRIQIERGGGSLSTVLTPTERAEIKRQKRLIKNRESAQLSRQRKRDRVDELEAIIKDLDTVHTKLDGEVKQLEGDHIILKAELNQLLSVIRDSPNLSRLMLHMTSLVVLYTAVQKKAAEELVSNTLVRATTTLASVASSSTSKPLNIQPQYVC